ncbi:MAG: hypothetical protein JRE18_01760 [Deltaproteobacteria bacterium]|jgi:hypothetical protein|nr:hypothetical protein [Deltaproteobacteria bacterium]
MIKVNENTIPFQEGTRVKDLAECFDDAAMKAAALRAVLTSLPGVGYEGGIRPGGIWRQ